MGMFLGRYAFKGAARQVSETRKWPGEPWVFVSNNLWRIFRSLPSRTRGRSDQLANITEEEEEEVLPGDTLKTLHFFLKLFRGTRKCLRYMTF